MLFTDSSFRVNKLCFSSFPYHGQPGSYRFVGQISIDKRASVDQRDVPRARCAITFL